MKTLEKTTIKQFPKANFRKVESISFLEGVELFSEKNAKADEYLKKVKLPPR